VCGGEYHNDDGSSALVPPTSTGPHDHDGDGDYHDDVHSTPGNNGAVAVSIE